MTNAARRAFLIDVEGTTTPIAFVKDVLFPYARSRLAAFARVNADVPAVAAAIRDAAALAGDPTMTNGEAVQALLRWSDEDRKATPLKSLQGLIWRGGYESGEIAGQVFADAAAALRDWKARGIPTYVYSSGSVEAQKLLFRHSSQGDLLPTLAGHFDTTTGGKLEPQSYRAIADQVGVPTAAITFLSDHTGELIASRNAGMNAIRVKRADEPTVSHEPWDGPVVASLAGLGAMAT